MLYWVIRQRLLNNSLTQIYPKSESKERSLRKASKWRVYTIQKIEYF